MPEREKIKVPAATITRIQGLERVLDMAEDRALKVRNLRSALTTLFPVGTKDHAAYMRWCEQALTHLGRIEAQLKLDWSATLPDGAMSVDDLVAED